MDWNTTLKRIEAVHAEENLWIVGPETGKLLHDLVRVFAPRSIVEVGTSVGYSALWMAAALEANGAGKLWTVESHAQRFARAQANIQSAALGHRIRQVKGHAPEVFDEDHDWPEGIDLVFLDATKMEHGAYFEALAPRMSSEGILLVDNVHSHRFGHMANFVQSLYDSPQLKLLELPVGSGLLIARWV